MRSTKALGLICVSLFVAIAACSSDSESPAGGATVSPDAGGSSSGADGSAQGDDDDDDDAVGEKDAGGRPAPVFLEKSEYADLIEIDAKFPYDVTQKHAADATIVGSSWGRHGGPMVTTGIYGDPADAAIVQFSIPKKATDPATAKTIDFKMATELPVEFTYGADGFADLPFGNLSLLDYTGPDSPFPGEALIYDATYQTVKGRAKANGFYSGAGITDGENGLLVYSGLSPLAAAGSDTTDSGLYVTGICDDKLLAPAPCAASRKLFGWKGFSGPVRTDAHENVFVAASLTGGTTSDAVYGLGKKEITSGDATSARPIVEIDSGGMGSLAVLAPEGEANGWVLGLGYDAKAPIFAAPYTEKAAGVAKGTEVVAKAITRGKDVDGISVFADDEGDLWLAILVGDKGTFLELRRKP